MDVIPVVVLVVVVVVVVVVLVLMSQHKEAVALLPEVNRRMKN